MKNFLFSELYWFPKENGVWACPVHGHVDKMLNPTKSLESQTFPRAHRAICESLPCCGIALESGCPCFQATLWTDLAHEIILVQVSLQENPKLASHQVFLNWLNASDSLHSVALLFIPFLHHLSNWLFLPLHSTNISAWFPHWIKRRGVTSELLSGNKHIRVYVRGKWGICK